jgi:hypothetical protein
VQEVARTGPQPIDSGQLHFPIGIAHFRQTPSERFNEVCPLVRDAEPRKPTTGVAACCVCAAKGHAAAAPLTIAMNSRLFIPLSHQRGRTTSLDQYNRLSHYLERLSRVVPEAYSAVHLCIEK